MFGLFDGVLNRSFIYPITLRIPAFPLDQIDPEDEEDDGRKRNHDDIGQRKEDARVHPTHTVGKLHPGFLYVIDDVFQCVFLRLCGFK
jgi:hypothetical protein